ncbi:MAG: response regulator transcription factor [Clostridiales bacterium]|nr:response regulator transcription factor [Clostridiales bacterium]
MSLIYLVEDDLHIQEMEEYLLEGAGYAVQKFGKGSELFEALEKKLPALIMLDIMLPDEDGLSILKSLRKDARTRELPLLMVTAKTSEMDKVKGLDLGADDYITKPFGVMELVSRVRAVLRRTQKEVRVLEYEDLILDEDKHRVTVNGEEVSLTYKEFELLKHLMASSGTVMSRKELMEAVWGFAFEGASRTVDMHIKTLRKKLGESGKLIETIRNMGYRLGA